MRLYVIKDNVSGQISPIFYSPNNRSAQREFSQFLKSGQLAPLDFDMYEIGELNNDSEKPDNAPTLICDGVSRTKVNGSLLNEEFKNE